MLKMALHQDRFYVGGAWVNPASTGTLPVISPFTECRVGSVPEATAADIDRAVAAARNAFDTGPWRWSTPTERSELLHRAASLLEARSDELAALITLEMGSTAAFTRAAQVPGPIGLMRYYADLVRDFPFEEYRSNDTTRSLVIQEPVGVVAGIVPSNFPLLLAVSQVAMAIAAGCSIVLKPAPESPLDTYVLAEVLDNVGLPAGVLNIVPGGREAGEHLVRHPGIDKVAYTGSTAAGQRIASLCGERLTRVSLELGGKSAAIVLDDAPLDVTIANLLPLVFLNTGQACVAQSRVLVPRSRQREIVDALVDAIEAMPIGDPADPATVIGPLLAERQRDRVEGYIAVGRSEGADLLTGGARPQSQATGWFVEPTLFDNVTNNMRIAQEEIFGPVVAVIGYDDPAEAIRIANDSDYGLSGSVWTADTSAGIEVARRVRTGTFSVNGAFQAPDAPFGGFKQSGIGRECGPEGLRLFLETKSIAVPVAS